MPNVKSRIGSPGARRAIANVMIEMPMSVGIAYMSRRMMKSRNAPPSEEGSARRRPLYLRPLLLDPPLVDVVHGCERRRSEALQSLLRCRDDVRDVAEVVGLLVVQDLVEGLVVLLARGNGAVRVRGVPCLLDRLVHVGILEEREAETGRALGSIGDLARVPDLIRIGLRPEGPPD